MRKTVDDLRQKSMEHLGNLYSTAAGVSLSLGLYRVLEACAEVSWKAPLLLFVAFVLTLLPFYHGALLHLDRAYSRKAGPASKKSDIGHLFDFIMLFVESCLLVAMAYGVSRPDVFWRALLLLLAADIVWGLTRRVFKLPSGDEHGALVRWAVINSVTLLIVSGGLRFSGLSVASTLHLPVAYLFFVISLARTALDYILCWEFYYPAMPRAHSTGQA